jgi:hypothetical protein
MTRQEALLLIGNTDESKWKDELAEQVFAIKQFVLKSYHAPAVLRAKAKKMDQWAKAADLLDSKYSSTGNEVVGSTELPSLTLQMDDLLLFYRTYEQSLSLFKLWLLQTIDLYSSATLLENMAILEENKLAYLFNWCQSYKITPLPTDVKLSEFINSGEIIRSLLPYQNNTIESALLNELSLLNRELDKSVKFSNFTKN